MGSPKALLRVPRRLFPRYADRPARPRCSPVVVVLGAAADEIRAAARRSAAFVVNTDWQRGQTTSMQCGLRAVPPEAEGVLFTLVDHPAVSPATIDALCWPRPGPSPRAGAAARASLSRPPRPSHLVFARADPRIPGAARERRRPRRGAPPCGATPGFWTSTTPASWPISTTARPTAALPGGPMSIRPAVSNSPARPWRCCWPPAWPRRISAPTAMASGCAARSSAPCGRRVELGGVHFSLFKGPGFTVDSVVIHEDPAIGERAHRLHATLRAAWPWPAPLVAAGRPFRDRFHQSRWRQHQPEQVRAGLRVGPLELRLLRQPLHHERGPRHPRAATAASISSSATPSRCSI